MFETYILARSVNLMGFRLKLTLYVDCVHKDGDLRLLVDGMITPTAASPRYWEIDTPAKAETWFRRIDMDGLAERLWLEKQHA